jgi:hypothetical protein
MQCKLQQNLCVPPSCAVLCCAELCCAVLQVTGYCAWPGLVWSLNLCARFTWPEVVTTYEKGGYGLGCLGFLVPLNLNTQHVHNCHSLTSWWSPKALGHVCWSLKHAEGRHHGHKTTHFVVAGCVVLVAGKVLVRFYGDHSSSWVALKQLLPWQEADVEHKSAALTAWGKKNNKCVRVTPV